MKSIDPLYRDVACPHTVDLPVLGVRVTYRTNEVRVLEAVENSYGEWRSLDAAAGPVVTPDVMVTIVVHADGADPTVQAGPSMTNARFRIPDPGRLLVWSSELVAIADTGRRTSIAYLDASLLERSAELVDAVLDPMTLFQLGALDRQPVHGVAIRRGDAAIVLTGPSGVGKSTLAYAARSHGFETMGDEPVYVQTEPRPRLWCRSRPLRLTPDAAAHFSELESAEATDLASGKSKVLVPLSPGPKSATHTGLCLLAAADGGPPRLEALSAASAVAAASESLEEGYHLYRDTIAARLSALAQGGAWLLHVAGTPAECAALLAEAADGMNRPA